MYRNKKRTRTSARMPDKFDDVMYAPDCRQWSSRHRATLFEHGDNGSENISVLTDGIARTTKRSEALIKRYA